MTLTERDKKLVGLLVPIVVLLAYWFLILGPQRGEVGRLDQQLSQVQSDRDAAVGKANQLQHSRTSYAKDYATVVRLGKAIPATLDMPSLLVQLESAAKGAHIDFAKISAGERVAAAGSSPTASSSSSSSSSDSSSTGPGAKPPVAAGGAPAQSSPGKPVEQANNAAGASEKASSAAGSSSGTAPSGTPPSGTSSTTAGAASPGLDTVPLNFTFSGSFFDLADFFHRVKRFVRVANEDIRVQGRLMTIDGISFDSETFPKLTADVSATVYLSPKTQGTTGGATPQGPATTPTAAGSSSPSPTPPAPTSPPATARAQ